jgi:hypothetical protein
MNDFDKEKAATELRVIADKLIGGEVIGFVCGIGKPGGKFELISHFDAERYNKVCDCCGKRIEKDDFVYEVGSAICKTIEPDASAN